MCNMQESMHVSEREYISYILVYMPPPDQNLIKLTCTITPDTLDMFFFSRINNERLKLYINLLSTTLHVALHLLSAVT